MGDSCKLEGIYFRSKSIGLINALHLNQMNQLAIQRSYLNSYLIEGEDLEEDEEDEGNENTSIASYQIDFTREEILANQPDQLINHLDILLANGMLTHNTKTTIKTAIEQLNSPADRVKMGTYLILISPDYVILK